MVLDGEERQIGTVYVDSGQIIVVDPCYILEGEFNPDKPNGSNYDKACIASLSKEQAGQFTLDCKSGGEANACVSSSGFGDGEYPVYVTYKQGRVAEMRVVFISDKEENEDCDDQN